MGVGPSVKCDKCGRFFSGGRNYEFGSKNYCYECLVPMADSISEEEFNEIGQTQRGFINLVHKMGGLEASGGVEYWVNLLKTNAEELEKSTKELTGSESPRKSGCFIATAVYGSYSSPEVIFLRCFRDEILLSTYFGKFFIKIYYSLSPSIAKLIVKSHIIKKIVKILILDPIPKIISIRYHR